MPNKPRERFYLTALSKAIRDFPRGEVVEKEPPDFVIVTPRYRLGIEFTEFHLPPAPGRRPHQEQQTLKDRIVARAEQLHHEVGGPALYVSVVFHENRPLAKADIQPLAQAIAAAVLNWRIPTSATEPGIQIPWGHRPAEVSGILIQRSVDSVDRLWHADAGGWVAQVDPKQLAAAVTAKDRQESQARRHCDELWLVVVNDDFSISAPAEISDEARHARYPTPFDKLIWLLSHGPRAIELARRHLAA